MSKSTTPFVLTLRDHATLQRWSRMGSLAQRLGLRVKTLLLLVDGLSPKMSVISYRSRGRRCLTGGSAIQNLQTISKSNQDGWRALIDEPPIARLLLEDEKG